MSQYLLPAAVVIGALRVNSLHAGKFFMIFLLFADFFQSVCQTVWIQIRSDILSGLIWVQIVCKDHQQMTKFTADRQRVNMHIIYTILKTG